jgi:hypothetical protein
LGGLPSGVASALSYQSALGLSRLLRVSVDGGACRLVGVVGNALQELAGQLVLSGRKLQVPVPALALDQLAPGGGQLRVVRGGAQRLGLALQLGDLVLDVGEFLGHHFGSVGSIVMRVTQSG